MDNLCCFLTIRGDIRDNQAFIRESACQYPTFFAEFSACCQAARVLCVFAGSDHLYRDAAYSLLFIFA